MLGQLLKMPNRAVVIAVDFGAAVVADARHAGSVLTAYRAVEADRVAAPMALRRRVGHAFQVRRVRTELVSNATAHHFFPFVTVTYTHVS